MPTHKALLLFAIGLSALLLGSKVLVWGAVNIATAFGISDLIIGLTIVALGTSLPELAASIASALKNEHDIAIGNIIGSNMYNLLAVLAVPGFESFAAGLKYDFGYSRYKDVVSSIEFERILSASGPFAGHVQRLSDGKEPKKIAFLQCVGSRDVSCRNEYCSSVCCMYAIKEAVIAKEHVGDDLDLRAGVGAGPDADGGNRQPLGDGG